MEKAVLCYKADRLIALLPIFPSVCCLQYVNFVLQAKNAENKAQTDVCEPLMPDVAPEAHQNDCNYVSEFSGPTFDLIRTYLAWFSNISLYMCML